MGCIVPTSLFTIIIETKPVSSLIDASRSLGLTWPSEFTGKIVLLTPNGFNCSITFKIAGCSTADVIMCFLLPYIIDQITILFASVPLPVKQISLGNASIV